MIQIQIEKNWVLCRLLSEQRLKLHKIGNNYDRIMEHSSLNQQFLYCRHLRHSRASWHRKDHNVCPVYSIWDMNYFSDYFMLFS